MRKSGPVRWPPRGVAGGQRLPHLGGHPLAADPRWVPGNEVEPAARQDVGEVRFEGEERSPPVRGETAGGPREPSATGATPPKQRALVRPEPPPPSEQISILACGDQLGGALLERRDSCREQAPCERSLGTGELTQRLLLGRSGEAEERAPGAREPLDLPGRSGGCRGTAERAGQRERVDQGISLAHVAVQARQGSDPGKVGFVLFRHEGEPQTQLGEPYGGEFQVHTEEGMRHHVAADRGGGSFARGATQLCELLQRAERSEEHTSELQSQSNLVCRLLLEKKKKGWKRACDYLSSR